jgi:hypothetical protein
VDASPQHLTAEEGLAVLASFAASGSTYLLTNYHAHPAFAPPPPPAAAGGEDVRNPNPNVFGTNATRQFRTVAETHRAGGGGMTGGGGASPEHSPAAWRAAAKAVAARPPFAGYYPIDVRQAPFRFPPPLLSAAEGGDADGDFLRQEHKRVGLWRLADLQKLGEKRRGDGERSSKKKKKNKGAGKEESGKWAVQAESDLSQALAGHINAAASASAGGGGAAAAAERAVAFGAALQLYNQAALAGVAYASAARADPAEARRAQAALLEAGGEKNWAEARGLYEAAAALDPGNERARAGAARLAA